MAEKLSREYVRSFFSGGKEDLLGVLKLKLSGLEYLQIYSPRLFHVLHNICYKEWNQDENGEKVKAFLQNILGSSVDVHHKKALSLLLPHVDRVAIDAAEVLYDMAFLDISSVENKTDLLAVFETWCGRLLDITELYNISEERPLYLYDSTCNNEALQVHKERADVFRNYVATLSGFAAYTKDERYVAGVRHQITAHFCKKTEASKRVRLQQVDKECTADFKYRTVSSNASSLDTFVWVSERKVPEFFGAPRNKPDLWTLAYSLTRRLKPSGPHDLLLHYAEHLADLFNPEKQHELALGSESSERPALFDRAIVSEMLDRRSSAQLQQLKQLKDNSYLWKHKLVRVLSSFYLNEQFKRQDDNVFVVGEHFVETKEREKSFHSRVKYIVKLLPACTLPFEKKRLLAEFDALRRRRLRNLVRLMSLVLSRLLKKKDEYTYILSPVWSSFSRIVNRMDCFKTRVHFEASPDNEAVFAHAIKAAQSASSVLLCATSFVPRVLAAYSENAKKKIPMFVHTTHYILNFNRLELTAADCSKPTSDKICIYNNTLRYALRPIAGRELFGQYLVPQCCSARANEIKNITDDEYGKKDILNARHSFIAQLCDSYDDTAMLEKTNVAVKRDVKMLSLFKKKLSLFACLRLCAVERSVFSNYEKALCFLQRKGSWSKGNDLSDLINNTMQMLCLFEWYKNEHSATDVELLYGILLLEHVAYVYLEEMGN